MVLLSLKERLRPSRVPLVHYFKTILSVILNRVQVSYEAENIELTLLSDNHTAGSGIAAVNFMIIFYVRVVRDKTGFC